MLCERQLGQRGGIALQGVKYGSFLWDYYEENSAEGHAPKQWTRAPCNDGVSCPDCGSMDWRTFRSMPATQTTMDRLGVAASGSGKT